MALGGGLRWVQGFTSGRANCTEGVQPHALHGAFTQGRGPLRKVTPCGAVQPALHVWPGFYAKAGISHFGR